MPLQSGSSDAVISENIATLMHEGYPQEQAIAIAYEHAGRSRKEIDAAIAAWQREYDGEDTQKIFAICTEPIRRVKAKDGQSDGRIEGYLVKFSDSSRRDLDGEYFDSETDFQIGPYPYRQVLYHHGMDATIKGVPIGMIDTLKVDDVGVWAESQLDMRNEYVQQVLEWIDEGIISWSSGSFPHLVQTDGNGHIKMWPFAEGSLTLTPAEVQGTEIRSWRSMKALLKEHGEAKSRPDNTERPTDTQHSDKQHHPSEDNEMDPEVLKPLIEEVVNKMLADFKAELKQEGMMNGEEDEDEIKQAGMEEAEDIVQQLVEAMDEEDMPAKEGEMDKEDEEKQKALTKSVRKALQKDTNMAKIFAAMYKSALGAIEKQRSRSAKAMAAARESLTDQHLGSVAKSQGGGYKASGNGHVAVEEAEEWRYADGQTMAMGFKILARAKYPFGIPKHMKIGDVVSEEYARTMMQKCALEIKSRPPFQNIHPNDTYRRSDQYAFTKAWGRKADELDAVAITNQGAEWAFITYDTRLWDYERFDTKLFNMMVERGMRTMDVDGKTMNVKMRTGSPTVVNVPESRSLNSAGDPENVVQITAFTTDEKAVNVQVHAVAASYSDQLDEQSIIPVAENVNEDLLLKLAESRESVLINGDTTTSSSNINTDSTPAGGMLTPDYIAWDGFRHIPLVDYTDRGNATGAALAITDYIDTVALLDQVFFARREDYGIFIIDTDTEIATRKLLALLTRDTAGEAATIFSGSLKDVFQVPFYVSGFLGLAQADGTISDTSASNTKGQVLYVHAPYWQYGRQREVRVELQRIALGLNTAVVASVFHCLAARGDNAAAMSYNITV
jgi:phage head maturation protease